MPCMEDQIISMWLFWITLFWVRKRMMTLARLMSSGWGRSFMTSSRMLLPIIQSLSSSFVIFDLARSFFL